MKFVDKYAGWALCVMLTALARVFGLFRRSVPKTGKDSLSRILIIKFWGMGSIILASPLFKDIKDKFPDSQLLFFTLAGNKETVKMFPQIDRVLTLEIEKGIFKFLQSLIRSLFELRLVRLDLAIDLEFFTKFSAITTYLTGARERVGFKAWEVWRGDLHTTGVPFNRYWHVTRNFRNLLSAIGFSQEDKPRILVPFVPDATQSKAKKILYDHGLSGSPIVCINPNSGEIALVRKWPKENFIELSTKIARHFGDGLKIVFIGTSKEFEYTQSIIDSVPGPKPVNLAGKLSVQELAYVIRNSKLLITNDSGPLHLATALGVPTVSFFGPETPVLYGPIGAIHKAFYKNIDCSPCINVHEDKTSYCYKKSPQCLEEIEVDEVWLEISRILTEEGCLK